MQKYVKCIGTHHWDHNKVLFATIGKIYKFPNLTDDKGKEWDLNAAMEMWTRELVEATEEDWNKQEGIQPTPLNPHTNYPFIPGGIYVGEWGNNRVIFKTSTGNLENRSQIINAKDEYDDSKSGCCTGPGMRFREATSEEKQWLEACIKAKKFVPKEESVKLIPNSGEIYVIHFKDKPEYDSIFTSLGDMKMSDRLWLNGKGFEFKSKDSDARWSPSGEYEFRYATQNEKDWLAACNKARTLVPKPTAEYVPKIGDIFATDGTNDLVGRIMIGRYDAIKDSEKGTERCNGPLLGDFNGHFHWSKSDNWCYKGGKNRNARPCTLDEIKWFNACLKVNKFISKEEALKPTDVKVGDWVVSDEDFLTLPKGTPSKILEIFGSGTRLRLNEGHFDKKDFKLSKEPVPIKEEIELIDGKWYEFTYNGISARYIFKLKNYPGTMGTIGPYLADGLKKGQTSNLVTKHQLPYFKFADMEEVYRHFPEERPKEQVMRQQYSIPNFAYPMAVHITSKEDYDKIKSYLPKIVGYNADMKYYLVGGEGYARDPYTGNSHVKGPYINVEMSDIIFPVKEQIMENLPKARLEEAKKRYPVGTVFNSLGGNLNVEVLPETKFYESCGNIESRNVDKDGYKNAYAIFYKPEGDRWAEIVGRPKSELTSLPESWNITATTNGELEVIGKYFNEVNQQSFYHTGNVPINFSGPRWGYGIRGGSVPITFEQFKKWVLKVEPMKKEEFKQGDWVTCIGDSNKTSKNNLSAGWIKGLTFKVTSVTSDILWGGHFGCGVYIEEGHVRKATLEEVAALEGNLKKYPLTEKECSKPEKSLLEQAIERYPQGIKVKSLKGDGTGFPCDEFVLGEIKEYTSSCIGVRDMRGYLYYNGEWADPISIPTKQIDLSNTKIWIGNNPELSRKVQEKAFKLGATWMGTQTEVNYLGAYSLYIDSKKKLSYSGRKDKSLTFNPNRYKEIFPSDLDIYWAVDNSLVEEMVDFSNKYPTFAERSPVKNKGFDENEYMSSPYNQLLKVKVKTVSKPKIKLNY